MEAGKAISGSIKKLVWTRVPKMSRKKAEKIYNSRRWKGNGSLQQNHFCALPGQC